MFDLLILLISRIDFLFCFIVVSSGCGLRKVFEKNRFLKEVSFLNVVFSVLVLFMILFSFFFNSWV